MLKLLPFLTTHEQILISDEYIRIQEQLKDFCIPHVIKSTTVPRFCYTESVRPSYDPLNSLEVFYEMDFCTKFYNAL